MDVNFDGNISKDEMLASFKEIGVNCDNEIDSIMDNLDMDQSGALDFSEIKIVLIDWEKEIKNKVLERIFISYQRNIKLEDFKRELSDILPSEWNDFVKKVKVENGSFSVAKLKEYIKTNLVY